MEAFLNHSLVKLIAFLVPIGILVFAGLSFLKKKKGGDNKKATVKKSKRVKIKQSDNGIADVEDSEHIDIQQ